MGTENIGVLRGVKYVRLFKEASTTIIKRNCRGGVKYIAEEIKTKAEIDVICSKVPDSEKLLELKFIQF